MSKIFHAWRYDPKTGEGRIFDNEEDVPKGWVDRLPEEGEEPAKAPKAAKPKAETPAPAGDAPEPMTRNEIMAALKGMEGDAPREVAE